MTVTATPTTAPLPSNIDMTSLAPQISALSAAVSNLASVIATISAQTPAASGTVGAAGADAGAGTVAGGGGTGGMSCPCCAGATTTAVAGATAVGANAAPAAPLAAAATAGGGADAAPAPAPVAPVEEQPKEKSKAEKVVDFAKAALGKPYRFGAAGPDAFDCSGLTQKAMAEAGVSLTHSASAQMGQGTKVSKDDLKPGDLLFFDNGGHSAVYIGDGKLIHAPQPGKNVEEKPFTGWYQQHFTVAKRFV